MADALTFTLNFPFTSANGEQISTLPLKRLKRKDITAAQAVTKDEGVMEDRLVAKMLGITLEDLREFDIADSRLATEVLRDMAAARDLAALLGRSVVAGLRMQPSEIAQLDSVKLWRWVEVCQREINRRLELADKVSG
ncbi:phage tail assembly protein [Pseudomonas sp.]|jgi:hypothetical protein|uniref:phage tail assembly protein n=1 Tax=Pseudomonas sp. TaxID=306 RepID=UPI003A968BE0